MDEEKPLELSRVLVHRSLGVLPILHTLKPIDEQAILRAAHETGVIITAEEHQVGTLVSW